MKEQLKWACMAHPKSGEVQDIPIGEVLEKEVGEIEETYEIIGDHVWPYQEIATLLWLSLDALAVLGHPKTSQDIPGCFRML
jgi:hypothetical protein